MNKPAKLDRRGLLEALIPNPETYLVISGLAGPARDAATLLDDGPNLFTMAGAMGAAASMGLGVAMGAPKREVLVITGDGELLMNVGSLATIATAAPKNLTVICIDNACHGETGGQIGHSGHQTNLALMAQGAGITSTLTINTDDDITGGAAFLQSAPGPRFLLLRVKQGPPAAYKRNFNLAECRLKFQAAFQGAAQA